MVGWSGAGRRKVGAQGAPTGLHTDDGLLDAPAAGRGDPSPSTTGGTADVSTDTDVSTLADISTVAAAGERVLIACIWAQEGR